jgi:hypothetical protein
MLFKLLADLLFADLLFSGQGRRRQGGKIQPGNASGMARFPVMPGNRQVRHKPHEQ